MKERFREFPLTVEEFRRMMKKEDAKRATWFALGVSVIAILVGLVVWIAKRREKDLAEHYEYFDDDFDELDDDYEEFDESIYEDDDNDEDEHIEYVKIKDFISDDEVSAESEEAKADKKASNNEEVSDEDKKSE